MNFYLQFMYLTHTTNIFQTVEYKIWLYCVNGPLKFAYGNFWLYANQTVLILKKFVVFIWHFTGTIVYGLPSVNILRLTNPRFIYFLGFPLKYSQSWLFKIDFVSNVNGIGNF